MHHNNEVYLDDANPGVIAIEPTTLQWQFKSPTRKQSINIRRTQIPVQPSRQTTLHGIQGKTADPGYVAHWSFPPSLDKESIWLAHYMQLSRPRSLATLLSHGKPQREVIEGGPPRRVTDELNRLFAAKIEATNFAADNARKELQWPERRKPRPSA